MGAIAAAAVLSVFAAAFAHAAVPVEESVGQERVPGQAEPRYGRAPQRPLAASPAQPADALPGAPATDDSRRLTELFYQLQVLQQEVQELRGLVEEQAHQLNRLARDQREQYIDLDRRVAALRNNGAAPSLSTAPAPAAPVTPTGSGTERDAYTAAFNQMRARQFDEAAAGFNKLIVDYPNGQFTPNAFYWLGELYLAQMEYEKARQSFAQVVNLYPDHQKVPDAMYKLGVVYHRLDDKPRALEHLNRVRSQFPASSAAGLAASYAAELQ